MSGHPAGEMTESATVPVDCQLGVPPVDQLAKTRINVRRQVGGVDTGHPT
jgi:hypothetical protein